MTEFRITVSFLNGTFHGRGDDGVPEWPPSPLRLFQALMAVAASRYRTPLPDDVAAALDWLASQPPPDILTPRHHNGTPYQTSVPNNAMDIVAGCWSRGNETSKDAQPATHKAMKEIRPTYLLPQDEPGGVTFVWPIDQPEASHQNLDVLIDLSSRLFLLGWGIDLVAGFAEVATDSASGDRWSASPSGGTKLRTATPSTRRCLEERHKRFLERLSGEAFQPVPPLSHAAYEVHSYQRSWEPAQPVCAAFSLLQTNGSGFRAFPQAKTCHVAGMLRHAVAQAAERVGWSGEKIARFVLGHAENRGDTHQPVGRERFAYVPLPSLERRQHKLPAQHVGMIRRALIYVPAGSHESDINALRRFLSGCELISEDDKAESLITTLPMSDRTVSRYVPRSGASSWAGVTPVVLPGRDDRKPKKTESLLRKAIRQAGYSDELAEHALLDWRPVGFWPGAEHVRQFRIPQHLRGYPVYHVRIDWHDANGQPVAIPGPVVIGGGRYSGLGLFAAEPSQSDAQSKAQQRTRADGFSST